MIARSIGCALVFAAAACATDAPPPEPIIETVEVRVPVSVPCLPKDFDVSPDFRVTDETLRAAPDAGSRYVLSFQGYRERDAWFVQNLPMLLACVE